MLLCFELTRNFHLSFSCGVSLTRSQVVQQQHPTGKIKQIQQHVMCWTIACA